MNMIDVLVIAVIAFVLGLAVRYIIRAKKKGIKCIGCPDGAKCAGNCAGCSGNCCGSGAGQKVK